MPARALIRRWATWLALAATLWSAVGMATSQVLGGLGDPQRLALCSTSAQTPPGQADDGTGAAGGHCPWCAGQAHAPALPGASIAWRADPVPAPCWPPAFLHGRRTQHAWLSRRSRAPPAA